jgi:predicted flavoprotein YhiN
MSSHSPVATAIALLEQHREHSVSVKATQARTDFFPLLGEVAGDPSEIVEVEHKGLPGPVLLVNSAYREYVRQLEQAVRALLDLYPDSAPFRLAGSVVAIGDVDAAMRELRDDAARSSRDRFADL